MFCKQIVYIKSKNIDKVFIQEKEKPIVEFANQHDVVFYIGLNEDNQIIATYEAQGKTSAYCKGIVAEIKQMLKEAFRCKMDVLLYAY